MSTELDLAHSAMEAAPDDDAARLRFYQNLADAELFLLLSGEPSGGDIDPALFDLEEGRFVLAFDREERLSEFAGGPAAYAALPGRVIARTLTGQGVGLGLNLGVAPSAFLMPAEALAWLTGMLDHVPGAAEGRPVRFSAPKDVPDVVLRALDAKLARLAGLAARAHLVAVTYEGGATGHLLIFEAAREGAEAALAKAVSEALVFSGVEAGSVDVTFLAAEDPALASVRRAALSFDLPEPLRETAQILTPEAPGMDPTRPPKLR